MPLTLDEYDYQVGHHLKSIRTECALIISHASAITRRPVWEMVALDDLHSAEAVLFHALHQVQRAKRIIEEKPRDE
jgi:hypothetical protein